MAEYRYCCCCCAAAAGSLGSGSLGGDIAGGSAAAGVAGGRGWRPSRKHLGIQLGGTTVSQPS